MADFFGFKITTSKKQKVLFDYANTTPGSMPNLAPKVMDMGGLRKGVGLKMSPAKWRA